MAERETAKEKGQERKVLANDNIHEMQIRRMNDPGHPIKKRDPDPGPSVMSPFC